MDLPVNVETGMVVGRYIVDVIDGPDSNLDPDAQPVQGRIVFTSSVPYLPNPTAAPDPVTIMRAPIVGVLDGDGYLCTPYPGTLEPQYRGVRLIATDDPDIAVNDWTWDVTYIFEPVNGHKLAIPAHGFSLPSGETVDLTKVAKVPSSPGYSLPQAEAAVLRAEAIAQSIRDDADNGMFNGEAATLEIGDVVSGSSAGVVNVGDEQHAILNITLEKGDKGDTGTGVPEAGAALQVMRMDSAGAATEWVTPTKSIVGLSNVDNTSDMNKPVSTMQKLALDEKADKAQIEQLVADAIADDETLVDAAAAAVNANPKIASIESALSLLNGKGQRGYEVKETVGRTVSVWDYLNNREQVIYGDTGTRNISSLLNNSTGSAYLTRQGNTVTLDLAGVVPSSALTSGSTFMTLPSGFRPTIRRDLPLPANSVGSTSRAMFIFASGGIGVWLPSTSDSYRLTLSFPTVDPWPTALPGVAA